MKNAIIYFEGSEVCRLFFDNLISLNDSNCFFIKGDEVASFPKSYGYAIVNIDSHFSIVFTTEEKDSIRETIKKEFTI